MAELVMVLDNILGCVDTVFFSDPNNEEEIKTDDKMPVPLLNCQRCSRNYSDDYIPRSLSCGHSLCTPCAEALLADEKPCPECLEKQQKTEDEGPPVNYQLLRISRSLRRKKINISAGKMMLLSTDIPNFKSNQDLSKCSTHDYKKELFCRSCNVWICENCLVVDHPLPPRGSCRVLQAVDAMKQIRDKYREVAASIRKEIDTMKHDFELGFGMHKLCLKHCTKESSHLRLLKRTEPLLEGQWEGNADEVKKAKDRLKELTDSFSNSLSPEDISASCRGLLDFQRELNNIIYQEKKRLESPQPYMNKHFRMELKRIAEKGEKVYVTMQEGENHRWSRVSLIEGRLLLYALMEGKPPNDGLIVPYKYLEMLIEEDDVPVNKKTVFFEVAADDGENLSGRIFVELVRENPLTWQTLLMCSGKKGVSYRNTRFFQKEKGRLSGGNYFREDGTEGGTIIEGLGGCYVPMLHRCRNSIGALLGDRSSTKFSFVLQNESVHLYEHIGYVKQGMDVIKAAAKIEPVTKCYVKDCGIFIPMKRKIDDLNDAKDCKESDHDSNDENDS